MILLDTSAWVEFLRGTGSRATVEVRSLLRDAPDTLVTCEPVAMELLAGATGEDGLRRLETLVDGLPTLALEPAVDFRTAAAVHRRVRRSGRTVRSLNDCLIAAVALRHDVTVVHRDADFEAIAAVVPLAQRSLRDAVG